jgi:hypothetical protein
MALTAERIEQLRDRVTKIDDQIARLRATSPRDVSKTSARRWAEQIDSLSSLRNVAMNVIQGAALRLDPEDPPGVTTIARARKGEHVEHRVAVVQTPGGPRVHIRRWTVPEGQTEWAPAARAIVLTLGELQVLTAGLLVAEAAVLKGP